jgi:glycosyltransferase involved in cell wall biosynthesis
MGIDPQRIFVVGNTEDIDAVDQVEEHAIALPRSEMVLLYVGGFGPHRGLDIVIRSMPSIIQQIPSALFVVVGDGPDRQWLEQLANRLGVAQSVRFEGRQPFSLVHNYIHASDVCLVPHLANPHTNATMPHKLFQYMYMEKPVIVSTAIPLARVVTETGAGLIFESGNPDSFARRVFEAQNRGLRRTLGQRGHTAVKERYNWRYDAQRLNELYRSITTKQKE